MIMVQKASQLPTPPSFNHRRAPSAPVVQPTKTPGLLSLSRPHALARPLPQQRQRTPRTSAKPVTHQRFPQAAHTKAQSVDLESIKERIQVPTPAATPDRPSRGRQQGPKGNKDKSQRPPSTASPIRRPTQHQPSPPQSFASPAEAPNPRRINRKEPTSNAFDPFVTNSSSDEEAAAPNALPVRQTTQLTPRPSGKLARRRQVPDSPTPAPTQAIPVRPKAGQPNRALARSVPLASPTTATRPAARRSSTMQARVPLFPVCDDTTDSEEDVRAPVTPIRSRAVPVNWPQAALFDDGPRTAPLASTAAGFGFMGMQTASPYATPLPRGARNHRRVPSTGDNVFNMSFDEDLTFGAPAMASPSEEPAQLLFGLQPSTRSPTAAAREAAALAIKHELFASSQFQNSPSPEDLPVPAFAMA